MTLQELNNILIKQNQHLMVEKFRTGYECFNIHTNRLVASATTVDELKEILVRMDIIRG